MGNIEEQREVENNGQKEKGFDEQREVYRQGVREAKNDMGRGERNREGQNWGRGLTGTNYHV